MSSRTTAPPGRMEPQSPSRRPRRPTRSAPFSRPPRGITPCRLPSTARVVERRAFLDGAFPCRTMEGSRVRRLQGQPCGLPRPRRQLPRPDPAGAPAPDRHGGRRRLVGPCRHRLVPRSGAGIAGEERRRWKHRFWERFARPRGLPSTAPWRRQIRPRGLPGPTGPRRKRPGIEMPEPPAELRPWRPGIADTDYWDERSAFAGGRHRRAGDAGRPRAARGPGALIAPSALPGPQGESDTRAPAVRPRAAFRGLSLVRRARARHRHRDPCYRGWRCSVHLDSFLDKENGGEPGTA